MLCFSVFHPALAVCPLYWTPFEDSCYVILQDKQSWASSMAMCQAYGAYLVEISSDEENEFVRGMIRETHSPIWGHWLGATDEYSESHWLWSHSGRALYYSNWEEDQPDNYQTSQHCAVMHNNGRWDDGECDLTLKGICERDGKSNTAVGK
ncbi:perlucin-like protein [Gigantopelta aegis]|uniref:perlucin-like protein n=1 Tax=Gigantopelta aegis TaxID=1735272 RepID=UPI001B88BF3B|nr:perlucin-like protein [Gigantopelta aegis]